MSIEALDFSGLENQEILNIKNAISKREDFYGYIPDQKMDFILKNYMHLSKLGCLESNWIGAYVHGNWPKDITFEIMKAIFDLCNRDVLHTLYPVTEDHLPILERGKYHSITLFRGCASPAYRHGMSWTTNLSKAIWYAAHHRSCDETLPENQECSVYATIVTKKDIYCFLRYYEPEYIVAPEKFWKIDIPQEEFRTDRARW
jgi:hypothetical protein